MYTRPKFCEFVIRCNDSMVDFNNLWWVWLRKVVFRSYEKSIFSNINLYTVALCVHRLTSDVVICFVHTEVVYFQ